MIGSGRHNTRLPNGFDSDVETSSLDMQWSLSGYGACPMSDRRDGAVFVRGEVRMQDERQAW